MDVPIVVRRMVLVETKLLSLCRFMSVCSPSPFLAVVTAVPPRRRVLLKHYLYAVVTGSLVTVVAAARLGGAPLLAIALSSLRHVALVYLPLSLPLGLSTAASSPPPRICHTTTISLSSSLQLHDPDTLPLLLCHHHTATVARLIVMGAAIPPTVVLPIAAASPGHQFARDSR
ncbi:hypothetical protein BDV93DRAFT_558489 [Ceratobasidium sp. AG-I]|nr:hypothetical protein BDV93DRAFT_558489 [Ceratobasidium sp. AG-I]